MGIVRGLGKINDYYKEQDRKREAAGADKIVWFSLDDNESATVRFLQELDEDSPNYSEKNGLGFIAVEHTNPNDWKRKALCTSDEGDCYGCEQHKADWKAGWKARSRMYINVLVEKAGEDPQVVVLSQGNGPKSITPTVLEYAGETGSITNRPWKVTRKGLKTDTSYLVMARDPKDFTDTESFDLFDLEKAVRAVPYEEQEAFYNANSVAKPSETATAAKKDSDPDAW